MHVGGQPSTRWCADVPCMCDHRPGGILEPRPPLTEGCRQDWMMFEQAVEIRSERNGRKSLGFALGLSLLTTYVPLDCGAV